jgi:hypothetical protein
VAKPTKDVTIELLFCPYGHKAITSDGRGVVQALAVDGTRITSLKCCGQWETKRMWLVERDGLLKALGIEKVT